MKVWAVAYTTGHEVGDIISIHATREGAERAAKASRDPDVDIQEYEVQD